MAPEDLRYVYRAVAGKQWIASGIIQPQAFKRRPRDTEGLSVGVTPEAASAPLQIVHGMIRVDVQQLRTGGYWVDGTSSHRNICEVPYWDESLAAAINAARDIITCSEIVPYPDD